MSLRGGGMRRFLSCLAICVAALLPGCDQETPYVPELINNAYSSQWHGVYVGTGVFSASMHGINERDVAVVVRLNDLGDNRVNVKLNMNPDQGYSPRLWIDANCESLSRASGEVQITGTTYHVRMARSGNHLTATMFVIGAGETSATWTIGLSADRDDPGEKSSGDKPPV